MLDAKIDCVEETYSLIVGEQKVGEGSLKEMVALHGQIEARAKCVLYPYNERQPTDVPEGCNLEQCSTCDWNRDIAIKRRAGASNT